MWMICFVFIMEGGIDRFGKLRFIYFIMSVLCGDLGVVSMPATAGPTQAPGPMHHLHPVGETMRFTPLVV